MKAAWLIAIFIWLGPHYLNFDQPAQFVIWNVGQGLWTTLVQADLCLHIDAGGEFAPWHQLRLACRHKANAVALSHWDWDHIGFVRSINERLMGACLLKGPEGPASPAKNKLIDSLPSCALSLWQKFDLDLINADHKLSAKLPFSTNEASQVFVLNKNFLLPGDSPSSQEKRWILHENLRAVRWLILGHHGSQTSTSKLLLNRLPFAITAIASARKKRYGHPHVKTLNRLKEFRVPVLRTEDWGSIAIEL